MAESWSYLLAAMDRLWFNHIILLPQPISGSYSKTTLQCSSALLIQNSSISEEDCLSSNSFTSSTSQDDCSNDSESKHYEKERPSRLQFVTNKTRSQPSSPSIKRLHMSSSDQSNDKGQKLQRYSSCKTLQDLEQEELKGFMDLGFQFEKDQLSPRTMTMIPGLQRLGDPTIAAYETYGAESRFEDAKNGSVRPYLSEAWLVKKPDSPLLRLRMSRVSTAQEMKKCLKLWARTVASSVNSDQREI